MRGLLAAEFETALTGFGRRPRTASSSTYSFVDQPVPHFVVKIALALRLREPRSLRELGCRPPGILGFVYHAAYSARATK